MGDYTTVRFEAKLHDKGVEMVRKLHEFNVLRRTYYPTPWEQLHKLYPMSEHWLKMKRHSFIPFGGLAYCQWDDLEDAYSTLDEDNKTWSVACSLKPGPEVATFVAEVLPLFISEPCILYDWFEFAHEPTAHEVMPREESS